VNFPPRMTVDSLDQLSVTMTVKSLYYPIWMQNRLTLTYTKNCCFVTSVYTNISIKFKNM